jgi:hypothetical protein
MNGPGGAIYSRGNIILTNSTIAYNRAYADSANEAQGGGIYRAGGDIQVSNSTIARNTAEGAGGGIWNQGTPIIFRNSIMAENQAPSGPDCQGSIDSDGYNLLGDLTDCIFSSIAGDITGVNPRLALLYGNPYALALYEDSPAVDGGNTGGCLDQAGNPITVDQISTPRPLDGNTDDIYICDIGAFEYDPDHPPQWTFLPLIQR